MTIHNSKCSIAFVLWTPPSDVRRINSAMNKAFADGAQSVLVNVSESLNSGVAHDSLLDMGETTVRSEDVFLISATFSVGTRSDARLRVFLGPYFFSEDSLTWSRRPSYLYTDESETDLANAGNLSGADALLVSRKAWFSVGSFDVQVPSRLSPLEWSSRARAAGFKCGTRLVSNAESRVPPEVIDADSRAACIIGTYRLAWGHGLPCSAFSLLARRVGRALASSYPKPHFLKDYGIAIRFAKRVYWYLRNLPTIRKLAAASREVVALLKATVAPARVR